MTIMRAYVQCLKPLIVDPWYLLAALFVVCLIAITASELKNAITMPGERTRAENAALIAAVFPVVAFFVAAALWFVILFLPAVVAAACVFGLWWGLVYLVSFFVEDDE